MTLEEADPKDDLRCRRPDFRSATEGLLLEGFRADIVVFDPATIVDRASFEAASSKFDRGPGSLRQRRRR